ncbi:MAG: hypothetical protein AB7P49_00185 [Bdellovibrionales bacterium]
MEDGHPGATENGNYSHYYDQNDSASSATVSEAGSGRIRRRKTQKKLALGAGLATPAFDAFRKSFPQGPLCDPGEVPTDENVEVWSQNFVLAVNADMEAAESAAWVDVRAEYDDVTSALEKLDRDALEALEVAQHVELADLLVSLDAANETALAALGNNNVPENWESECETRKNEYIENWTKKFNESMALAQAPQRNDLIERKTKIEKGVEEALAPHRKNAKGRMSQHEKIMQKIAQSRVDLERTKRAEKIGQSVVENVSSKVGDGVTGDAAVLATSMVMKSVTHLQRRQNLYRVLRIAILLVIVLALVGGGVYAWRTRALANLFKRIPRFRKMNVVEADDARGPAFLTETPDPFEDYDHFFWMRNTSGICKAPGEAELASNSVVLPWSNGENVRVTITALSYWFDRLENQTEHSSCFCAQHVGLPLRAMRIVKEGRSYTMFNARPVEPLYGQALCNPAALKDDLMVRFESEVRGVWMHEEEDGPPPEWAQTRPFHFWKNGMFWFEDVHGKSKRIYLTDNEAACVTFCENMCK